MKIDKKYKMKKCGSENNYKAVFVGNGINRLFPNKAISWSNLLIQLKESAELEKEMPAIKNVNLDNPLKPFPFAFEELVNNGGSINDQCIKTLKREIRRILDNQMTNFKIPYNKYHSIIMNSSIVSDVITSNYDYGFEMSILPNFLNEDGGKHRLAKNRLEKTKSIFRGYKISVNNRDVNVWHMHGELIDCRKNNNSSIEYPEQSILIGYSHYGKYLSEIRDFVDGKYKNYGYIMRRLNDRDNIGDSWIDKFFTHDLDIIGLGLGFEEQDLWWLLNYRSEKISSNNKRAYTINNRIRFFMRKHANLLLPGDEDFKEKIDFLKNNAVREVLSSMRVEVEEIEAETWPDFYEKSLDKILNPNDI